MDLRLWRPVRLKTGNDSYRLKKSTSNQKEIKDKKKTKT